MLTVLPGKCLKYGVIYFPVMKSLQNSTNNASCIVEAFIQPIT
jgi:hypothetical protein